MEKRTILDQIEVRTSDVSVRFKKAIVDDAGLVVAGEWHRLTIPAGADPVMYLDACDRSLTVEEMDEPTGDLDKKGQPIMRKIKLATYPPVEKADRTRIIALFSAAFPKK